MAFYSFFFFFSFLKCFFPFFFFNFKCFIKKIESLISMSCKTFIRRELFEDFRNTQNNFLARDCCEAQTENKSLPCISESAFILHLKRTETSQTAGTLLPVWYKSRNITLEFDKNSISLFYCSTVHLPGWSISVEAQEERKKNSNEYFYPCSLLIIPKYTLRGLNKQGGIFVLVNCLISFKTCVTLAEHCNFFFHSVLNIFVLVAQELQTPPEKSPDMTRIVKITTKKICILNVF